MSAGAASPCSAPSHAPASPPPTPHRYPALSEFAATDLEGMRFPLPGDYHVTFGVESAAAHGMGFARARVVAVL